VKTVTITVFDFFFREFDAILGQGYLDQPHVAVGPTGTVYVSGWTGGFFGVMPSFDGGASFSLPKLADDEGNADPRFLAFGLNPDAFPDFQGLPHNKFRTPPNRAIAADPTVPGHVYAVEPIRVIDASAKTIDGADVFFARSADDSKSWQGNFRV